MFHDEQNIFPMTGNAPMERFHSNGSQNNPRGDDISRFRSQRVSHDTGISAVSWLL